MCSPLHSKQVAQCWSDCCCAPRYPQVICEKADKTDIPTIDKKKYLVPSVSSIPVFLSWRVAQQRHVE